MELADGGALHVSQNITFDSFFSRQNFVLNGMKPNCVNSLCGTRK